MKPSSWIMVSIVILSLLLVGSLLANAILFSRAQQYYLQLNGVRLDPLGLRVYPETINKPITAKSKKSVVFFGDSRAFSWPPPEGLPNFIFINRGIGSQTTEQVLRRYEAHIKPLAADILIVQVGINDLKTIPLFPNRQATIVEQTQTNIAQIVERAGQDKTTVILTTIFPLGQVPLERRLFWSPDVAQSIEAINAFLYTLEADEVVIFDTAAVLANEAGTVKPEYSRDLLHLNAAGYQALNQKLVELLLSENFSEPD
ncbi:MAG: SGNH/GDSL hydrolase family protein [Anaerolineae bacterium]|nr:SGNH/GDSL hydrolase family protein [Anaerolineae bacterium]